MINRISEIPASIPLPPSESEMSDQAVEKAADGYREELERFGTSHGLRGLSDRLRRGLEPIGLMAIERTREKVRRLAELTGASYEETLALTLGIQRGGPWQYSSRLHLGSDAEARLWVMLNAANLEQREQEFDMSPRESLAHIKFLENWLDQALQKPGEAFQKSQTRVQEDSKKKFRVEDGVPISEKDNGFLAMALAGYRAGIYQDADGTLFVGAPEIPNEIFEKLGLKMETGEDRGRSVTFFVNKAGDKLVKKLYPGFCVLLTPDFDLGKRIVRAVTGEEPSTQEAGELGHVVYAPTSLEKHGSPTRGSNKIKRSSRIPERTSKESASEISIERETFLKSLAYWKSQQIFRDKAIAAIRKLRLKKQRPSSEDLDRLAEQTETKMEQKMDELRYLMEILGPEMKRLPSEPHSIVDMAGGAGDLGLAVATELFAMKEPVRKVDIVDPVPELAEFQELLTERLPNADKLKPLVESKVEPLQEAEISPDSIVVAKHACGDLTDTIIEKWTKSESPLLMIMTCCQDKAKNQPARYGLSQEEWQKLCRDSTKTNAPDPKKQAEGMKAMTRLDLARVAYLKRHGFEAELVQTDQFPKGDVIVARRKTKT